MNHLARHSMRECGPHKGAAQALSVPTLSLHKLTYPLFLRPLSSGDINGDNSEIDNDPYANIEMSKDRVEEVIEVEEDAKTYKIQGRLAPSAATSSSAGPSSSNANGSLVQLDVEEMTRSEWMKGCAEGSENSVRFARSKLRSPEGNKSLNLF